MRIRKQHSKATLIAVESYNLLKLYTILTINDHEPLLKESRNFLKRAISLCSIRADTHN